MYISSLMLVAMYEGRVSDHLDRLALQPGRARSPRIPSWATRIRTAPCARSAFGAARADAEAAGVTP